MKNLKDERKVYYRINSVEEYEHVKKWIIDNSIA